MLSESYLFFFHSCFIKWWLFTFFFKVGSGLIIGTIFSAPVIFASIRMLQVKNMVNVQMFDVLIGNISQDVSIGGILFCVSFFCLC